MICLWPVNYFVIIICYYVGYCHTPGVVGGGSVIVRHCAKTLTFSNIFVITEDIYLKLIVVVNYQKGNLYQ